MTAIHPNLRIHSLLNKVRFGAAVKIGDMTCKGAKPNVRYREEFRAP